MSTTADMLAEVPLFAQLDADQRALLAQRVDEMDLEAGTTLWEYGDPGDWMVILKSGSVELSVRTKTGEKVFLELASAGDFFGEISLLDQGPRTATASVVKSGEALIVDRGDLEQLLELVPAAAHSLLAATGKRMRQTASILRNTASRNVNDATEAHSSVVLRVADWVANFSGSITFLLLHIAVFTAWIVLNIGILPFGDFDKYPFGLLTMVVSLEAIILSTLLLFSSNRQAARDRVRSDIEYDVNLKAELQIQHLHEKIDDIHAQILGRLDAIAPHQRHALTPPPAPTP